MAASTLQTSPRPRNRAGLWARDRLHDGCTLLQLATGPFRRGTHEERLERFYRPQAEHYDQFRSRLLHGREELFAALPIRDGGVLVDLGAGTCASLEFLADRMPRLERFVAVDLADSLLAIGRDRCRTHGWRNVEFIRGDAASVTLPAGRAADVVTFSYSLTMMPDWRAAIDRAHALLAPGGVVGVVDFYVARQRPLPGWAEHSWLTRRGWPRWFALTQVCLHPEHLPTLASRFETVLRVESSAPVPYLPGPRVPCYRFIGRKV